MTTDEAREIFTTLLIFVHGYVGIFANNEMKYDEKTIAASLTKVFYGAINAVKEAKDERKKD